MAVGIVVCPRCETNLQNSEGIAGQIVACPQCQTQLRMPDLVHAALPGVDALPPAIELPQSTQFGSAPSTTGPAVRTTPQSVPGSRASVSDRLRRRSNPVAIFFSVLLVIVLIGVGSAIFVWDQSEKDRKEFAKQMIGNWELVPGQNQLERWDFAFHRDGELQMAVGSQLDEGRWRVVKLERGTGYVLIEWPDDAPETMRIRFESGTMQVELDSVGHFAFRAAVP